MSTPTLKAAYDGHAPHQPFTAERKLAPPSASPSTQETSAYLAGLRAAVASVQEEVNKELTARMVEDAAAAEAAGKNGGDSKPKQGKKNAKKVEDEEENYGEEVMDDDA